MDSKIGIFAYDSNDSSSEEEADVGKESNIKEDDGGNVKVIPPSGEAESSSSSSEEDDLGQESIIKEDTDNIKAIPSSGEVAPPTGGESSSSEEEVDLGQESIIKEEDAGKIKAIPPSDEAAPPAGDGESSSSEEEEADLGQETFIKGDKTDNMNEGSGDGGETNEYKIKQDEDENKKDGEEQALRNLEILNYPERQSKSTFHMTKWPNMININASAFDPSTYDAVEEEEKYRGHVHNIIRWRYKREPGTGEYMRDDNGKLLRESNARFVKWSDGSTTLHVNDEMFDVDEFFSAKKKDGFLGLNGYLYLNQKANGGDKSEETVLECIGPINSKITARPSSLRSEAHRNLTLAVRQKNLKKARIEEFNLLIDPEKEKKDRIRNKDDLLKYENRPTARRSTAGARRKTANRYYMNAAAERGYDSVNISTLKRMNEDMPIYDDDYGAESGSDDEWEKKKMLDFKKASKEKRKQFKDDTADEDDEEDLEDGDDQIGEDDSDAEEKALQSSARKRSRQTFFDDDDED